VDVIRQIDIALDNDVVALLVRAPWRTGCYSANKYMKSR